MGSKKCKNLSSARSNGENVVQSINLAHTEWISSLEKTQGDQNLVDGQLTTSTNNQDLDLDVRIFCDGAVNKEANKLGVGCIAYSKDGSILTRLSKEIEGDSAIMAEILAIEKALDLAIQHGRRKVGFFSDSKIAIDSIIKSQYPFPWEIYTPLQKILEKKDVFTRVYFTVISRGINGEAHSLVRARLCTALEIMLYLSPMINKQKVIFPQKK